LIAMPFLPEVMKNSTSSSSEPRRTSAIFSLAALRWRSLGSAASLVASSAGAPPMAVPSLAAFGTSTPAA
jgi:hypothetical protein